MSTSAVHAQPMTVVFVASWYPAIDDPGLGRFVADQAEALLLSGLATPFVASFATAHVDGAPDARRAGIVADHLRRAVAKRGDTASSAGWPPSTPIAVARLPAAESPGNAALPAGHDADQRRTALDALADRLDTTGLRGVVHAHTAYPDGYAALGLATRLDWPLVITEHASFVARQLRQPEHRRRYLEAARAASRFIAVSDTLAMELRAAIPEIAERLVVIPNVVPLHAFDAAGLEDRDPDELIFVGDRKERKGIVVLLRAFADVLEARPSATLRLIGKSPSAGEEARWRELADDLGVARAVRFEGLLDRAGIAAALRRASVFVHPSPRETFGVVTLEALAAGTPVVATESGGISGILEDERLGALVPARDSRMLARAVLRTLERRAEFDPQALRAAAARFSGEEVAPRLAALYTAVIAEAEGTRRGAAPSVPPTVNWRGSSEPIAGPVVAVARNTERAIGFLAGMPAELLARITLVTDGGDGQGTTPSGLAAVVRARDHINDELRQRGLHGGRMRLRDRLIRLAANPVAPIRRRLVRGGRAELRWQASAEGMRRAVREALVRGGEETPEVVCLDVLDYVVAREFIAGGELRAAPGGLAWLADRWAATQVVVAPSAATATDRVPASVSSVG